MLTRTIPSFLLLTWIFISLVYSPPLLAQEVDNKSQENNLEATAGEDQLEDQVEDPLTALDEETDAKVIKLFQSFRDKTYRTSFKLPDVEWDDIPVLLKMAKSQRRLTTFPINPLSSQGQIEAIEGVIALWLIEGIRSHNERRMFPSLNPLCLSDGNTAKWELQTETNFPDLLNAYEKWWKDVAEMDPDEAKEVDPLSGLNIRWY